MMDWKNVLAKIAPTAASLLVGPFAGMAVQALGEALGIDAPTQGKIEQAFKNGQLSGEQLVAVKIAEQNLAIKLEELGVKREEIEASDRANARGMQIATRSWVPAALSIMITLGFFGVLAAMFKYPEIKESAPLMIMLGALGAEFGAVCKFWLGGNAGSDRTKELLAQSQPIR
jgi:hypothetical protein